MKQKDLKYLTSIMLICFVVIALGSNCGIKNSSPKETRKEIIFEKELPTRPPWWTVNVSETYTIVLTNMNKLFVSEELVHQDSLSSFVADILTKNSINDRKKIAFIFKVSGDSNFEIYENSLNSIRSAYDNSWIILGEKVYKKKYEDLSELQLKNIKSTIPLLLHEVEF